MKKNKKRIFIQILKNTGAYKIIITYIIFFILTAVFILLSEPTITRFQDALWYCYVSSTSTGFGDFVATNIISRFLTAVLYLYTIGVIAIITALITNFFIEIAKSKKDESVSEFLNDLERLPELSKEELENISKKVKERKI